MFYVSEVKKKKAANPEQDIQIIKQIDDYSEFNIVKNWHQVNKQDQIMSNNTVRL